MYEVSRKLLVTVHCLKMSVLTSRAGFYKIQFDSVLFPLNNAEGFGIRFSRRSAAKDESSLVLITDLGDFLQVPAQLEFCLQSFRDIWKLSHMHCRFQKMTACHLTLLNGNVCCSHILSQ